MIHHVQGNLLRSDCTFIAHQANCQKRMGSGIAYQIKKEIPELYQVDLGDSRTPEERLGGISYTRTKAGWGFNLYGQFTPGYGLQTSYKSLESALSKMLTYIPELVRFDSRKITNIKVGLPYLIGCGLAGGDWKIVYPMLERLSDHHKIDIYLYEFNP